MTHLSGALRSSPRGPRTPNPRSGNGDVANCVEANEWCYTCEPPAANDTLNSFSIFPEPQWSATWQQAVAYVEAGAPGDAPRPAWDATMVPGRRWTDARSGVTVTVPGLDAFVSAQRDPYADLVTLAIELGCSGVDVDYEEMWHADYYKLGGAGGPWTLPQTVYKYAAVLKDVQLNIAASVRPSLMLSTAAGAVGAWSGNWWGGNLKGVWLNASTYYPDLMAFVSATGGVSVMTYDLSDNEQYQECPQPGVCALDQQVAFYMATYDSAGIAASVGYETGTPAYPDPEHDPGHDLPLTAAMLASITVSTQPKHAGGFMWEIFKSAAPGKDESSPTDVAQAVCNAVLPGNARCAGTIPPFSPGPPPPPPPAALPAASASASKTSRCAWSDSSS